jgi:ATP-dependent DNA helicase RecQ
MAELGGSAAFDAIAGLLRGANDDAWHAIPQSLERLRAALVSTEASQLDLAVLLRQALRFEHARRGYAASPTVIVTHPRLASFKEWALVGLKATQSPAGRLVSSLPWRPAWLTTNEVEGVDGRATSETVCREFNSDRTTGDPFIQSIGRISYRSPGQRAAVRAALSTPSGGTLVIALPTGEGKSMIFQLVQSVGFTTTMKDSGPGVTLVVVPTVALAINHELEAVTVCKLSKPLAYEGGNEIENSRIVERIADGTQGLCFASPEAACGALRHALRRAAEAGHLRALVIDEAHLVDQWGTGFRTIHDCLSVRK